MLQVVSYNSYLTIRILSVPYRSLLLFYSNDTDYFCVMHVMGEGLFAQAKDHLERIRVPCLDSFHDKISHLRKDFCLHNNTHMMVLLSLCTKDMNKYVAMFPEVWFVDCTAGKYFEQVRFRKYQLVPADL